MCHAKCNLYHNKNKLFKHNSKLGKMIIILKMSIIHASSKNWTNWETSVIVPAWALAQLFMVLQS